MSSPDLCWRHVVLSTHRSWLPGDPRGFRSKRHKTLSSGDYKHRPLADEHAGLYRYNKSKGDRAIVIPRALREKVGRKFLEKLDHPCLAMAVAGMHLHMLAELPVDLASVKGVLGRCKAAASHAIRDALPGRVWAHDGDYKRIADYAHQKRAYRYILDQENAWIWDYRKPHKPDDER